MHLWGNDKEPPEIDTEEKNKQHINLEWYDTSTKAPRCKGSVVTYESYHQQFIVGEWQSFRE